MPRIGTSALVIAGVALLAIVVVAIAGYVYLPSASISVTPKAEPIPPISLTVRADPNAATTDPEAGIVPASRVDVRCRCRTRSRRRQARRGGEGHR
jgi:hypothetical protein